MELATLPRELESGVVEWEHPYEWHRHGPPIPPCQEDRMTTVRAIVPGGYADPPHYPKLGPLLDLACKIFGTESAGVTIMDDRRMFIVEARGKMPLGRINEDWSSGFCCWSTTGSHPSVLTVEDSHNDARFQRSKVVTGGLKLRFYMGAPLVASNGHRIGVFCIMDPKPRKVDATSAQILSNIAELATRELEKKWAMQLERACLDHVLRSLDCYDQGFLFVEASQAVWQILHVSPAAAQETGLPEGTHDNMAFWDMFEFENGMEGAMQEFRAAAQRCKPFTMAGVRLKKRGEDGEPSAGLWDLSFRPASKDTLSQADCAPVGIPCTLPGQLPGAIAALSMFFVQVEASYEDAHEIAAPSSDFPACAPKHLPFQDLELGPLICKEDRVRFYRGTHHGREVVLKIIDKAKEGACDEDTLALTGAVTTRLRHPCIVRVLAHCVTDGGAGVKPWDSALSQQGARYDNACWMLLEYCDRGTLLDAVEQGWFLRGGAPDADPDMAAIKTAALQIATGMAYLHGRDLIHGNLNSESVWLTSAEAQSSSSAKGSQQQPRARGAFNCKVGNFALARETILARLGMDSYASISHYPPELLKDKTITKAADCYAFGILMWEMYTSTCAWLNMSHAQVVRAVLTNRKLAWPSDVPDAYRELACACMAYDLEDRPAMSQVVERLHAMGIQ